MTEESGIQIRFTGKEPYLIFAEVEDRDGNSVDIGEWKDDGEDRLLKIEPGEI